MVAELTDLAARVTIVQSYHSNEKTQQVRTKALQLYPPSQSYYSVRVKLKRQYNEPRVQEAKYVFPIAENSAVCGFEAYIGAKHVVGVVCKKEEARREYRAAVKAGHGAYLMEQEKPDLFSISLGNVPAGAITIHIKILYVTELKVDKGDIVFTLPTLGVVSNATSKMTQLTTATKMVELLSSKVHFQASLAMPFNINKIFSPGQENISFIEICSKVIEIKY